MAVSRNTLLVLASLQVEVKRAKEKKKDKMSKKSVTESQRTKSTHLCFHHCNICFVVRTWEKRYRMEIPMPDYFKKTCETRIESSALGFVICHSSHAPF